MDSKLVADNSPVFSAILDDRRAESVPFLTLGLVFMGVLDFFAEPVFLVELGFLGEPTFLAEPALEGEAVFLGESDTYFG